MIDEVVETLVLNQTCLLEYRSQNKAAAYNRLGDVWHLTN